MFLLGMIFNVLAARLLFGSGNQIKIKNYNVVAKFCVCRFWFLFKIILFLIRVKQIDFIVGPISTWSLLISNKLLLVSAVSH